MTMYAPSDIHSITIPEPAGCGSPHEADDTWPQQRMTIDCPLCELALAASPLGFARTETGVKPTCDEVAEQERLEKAAAANGARRLAQWQLGADAAPARPGPSLAEQVLALSPAQKAALRTLLSVDDVPAVEELPDVEDLAADPVKRGPGRPRKTPAA